MEKYENTLKDNKNIEKFKRSLKRIRNLLIFDIILWIILISISIWYAIETSTILMYPDGSEIPVLFFILSALIIIFTILAFLINLIAAIIILVSGTKYKETKEIALIFGLLGIFFSWIFILIYYFVAKSKVKNLETHNVVDSNEKNEIVPTK